MLAAEIDVLPAEQGPDDLCRLPQPLGGLRSDAEHRPCVPGVALLLDPREVMVGLKTATSALSHDHGDLRGSVHRGNAVELHRACLLKVVEGPKFVAGVAELVEDHDVIWP